VCLAQVIRKCHTHGRLHIRLERVSANRAAFQVAIGNQVRSSNFALVHGELLLNVASRELTQTAGKLHVAIIADAKQRRSLHDPKVSLCHSASLRRSQPCNAKKCQTETSPQNDHGLKVAHYPLSERLIRTL